MAIIFVLSGIPNLGPLPAGLSDKTGHSIGYAILGAAALRAFAGARRAGVTWTTALWAWLLASAYGATDEIHQIFVPGRTAALDDWAADAIGAGAAVLAGWLLSHLVPARPRGTRDV